LPSRMKSKERKTFHPISATSVVRTWMHEVSAVSHKRTRRLLRMKFIAINRVRTQIPDKRGTLDPILSKCSKTHSHFDGFARTQIPDYSPVDSMESTGSDIKITVWYIQLFLFMLCEVNL
jgi:hypothetical protein